MPILTKKNKAKRGVFTVDMSVVGQGTAPYPAKYGITLSPASGSSFPTSSHVIVTATPLGAYTAPATYTWYLEGLRVSDVGVASNVYDFGDLDGPRTASVAVDVITAGGTVRASTKYAITDDDVIVALYDTGTGTGTMEGAGNYNVGDPVTITALPTSGSKFTKWEVVEGSTPADTGSAVTGFTVTQNTEINAEFALKEWELTLNATGSGTASILWGGQNYDTGEIATLTAAAAVGSTFEYYQVVSGDTLTLPSGSADNYVTMSQATVINAWFSLD
jgi:hypothetical protein